MLSMLTRLHAFFLLILLILLAGCGDAAVEVISEKQEKSFLRGDRYKREGRHREALNSFLKVIEKREDAAESHLEVGTLYLKHIKDPISAIYHFRKYLELRPSSVQANIVRQMIDTSKKEFARTLAGHPFDNDIDRIDLLELVKQLKKDNRKLKEQLAASDGQSTTITEEADNEEEERTPVVRNTTTDHSEPTGDANDVETRPAFYTIQPGDNLSRISSNVYGNPGRWMDIYQANRDKLSDPNNLTVGVELRIP